MKNKLLPALTSILCAACISSCSPATRTVEISRDELLNKIKGGWAAQTIGVCYGQPTEFRYNGMMIPDSVAIAWDEHQVEWYFNNDDIYMDLTFVGVMDRIGIDAPADSFAVSFANAGYNLWHANQSARYNILHGIMPPESGHWKNNPHANDIDFQIEADFAGLMSPGMPCSSAEIADKVGHLMCYGDGWYGGVFIAAMYTKAFFCDDVEEIATEALKMIPEESHFHQCMTDVLDCHTNDPSDWKVAWEMCQQKWAAETGCPDGMFAEFNIDALVNSAYLLIGLLYGDGDFGRTMEIATRCGQDSDCNPASAAGILGTMKGYDAIPAEYLDNLKMVENRRIDHTPYSLTDVYSVSFNQALEMIERGGGKIDGSRILIRTQKTEPVRLEVSFEGLKAEKKTWIGCNIDEFEGFTFNGSGIVLQGGLQGAPAEYCAQLKVILDGKEVKVMDLPSSFHSRSNDLFWQYDLKEEEHRLSLEWLNPVEGATIRINDALTYNQK